MGVGQLQIANTPGHPFKHSTSAWLKHQIFAWLKLLILYGKELTSLDIHIFKYGPLPLYVHFRVE